MKINTRGKNIELTPALKDYVEEKVGRIEKYFDHASIDAQVSLGVERERHTVEVTAFVDGLILRGEEATGDMYASIDGVMEKIERQIRKHKTRINRKFRERKEEIQLEMGGFSQDDEEEQEGKIVKIKRFSFKPMSVEEAVMQMDLLGHDFFVFTHDETEELNVVYRRKDGDYGLIEPLP